MAMAGQIMVAINSNTTLVKVKLENIDSETLKKINSNTTLVKVKYLLKTK